MLLIAPKIQSLPIRAALGFIRLVLLRAVLAAEADWLPYGGGTRLPGLFRSSMGLLRFVYSATDALLERPGLK